MMLQTNTNLPGDHGSSLVWSVASRVKIQGANMWLDMVMPVSICVLSLYLPGICLCFTCGVRKFSSVLISPIISTVIYVALGILFQRLGIFASFFSLVFPVFIISVSIALIKVVTNHSSFPVKPVISRQMKADLLLILAYVGFGILLGLFMYIKPLDGPSSAVQTYDNVHHFALTRSFYNSGEWSILRTSPYLELDSPQVASIASIGFYPAAWNVLCVLVLSATGCAMSIAVNALNFVLAAIVYPLTMLLFIDRLFRSSYSARLMGSLAPCAIGVFPWMLLDYWPLYPNFLSMVFLPALLFCFIEIFVGANSFAEKIRYSILFLLCSVAVAVSQPNGIFTAGVILTPFSIWVTGDLIKRLVHSQHVHVLVIAGRVLVSGLIISIWIALFFAPFLQGVIWFNWDPLLSFNDALYSIINMSFIGSGPQPLLAIIIVCGVFYSIFDRDKVWILCSFALCSLLYLVAVSVENDLIRHFATGFWYTDPYRLAVMAGLCSVPLFVMGMQLLYDFCSGNNKSNVEIKSIRYSVLSFVMVAIGLCGFYNILSGESGLVMIAQNATGLNNEAAMDIYDDEEQQFVETVNEMVPEDSLIINAPYDGSLYSYGLDNANVYYRSMSGYGNDRETNASEMIRLHLFDYASNGYVREAVEEIDADYVMLLKRDSGRSAEAFPDYVQDDWLGIEAIEEDTPGFELVYSEDGCNLFRIIR